MIKSLLGVLLLIPAAAADEAFTVRGTLKFAGEVPKPKVHKQLADTPACCALHKDVPPKDDLVIDESGGVRWGFVYVKLGVKGEFKPPAEPVLVDQVGCVYTPHFVGAMVGQTVKFRNSDDFMHNVHGLPFANREFNFGQIKGSVDGVKFTNQEVPVKVTCNVHTFMTSYVGVVDHPFFAVTDAAGKFEIKNLPPGKYCLGVWHEKLTVPDQEIEVKGNLAVTFSGTLKK